MTTDRVVAEGLGFLDVGRGEQHAVAVETGVVAFVNQGKLDASLGAGRLGGPG